MKKKVKKKNDGPYHRIEIYLNRETHKEIIEWLGRRAKDIPFDGKESSVIKALLGRAAKANQEAI